MSVMPGPSYHAVHKGALPRVGGHEHVLLEVVRAFVPAASGNTVRQIQLMQALQPDALICTPSYALYIAEVARGMDVDPRTLPLRFAFFGGEMWTEDMRRQIEAEMD